MELARIIENDKKINGSKIAIVWLEEVRKRNAPHCNWVEIVEQWPMLWIQMNMGVITSRGDV